MTSITCKQYATNPTRGLFINYRRTKGYFNRYYGNYKWRDYTLQYTVQLLGEEEDEKVPAIKDAVVIQEVIIIEDSDKNKEVIVIKDSE